MSVNFLKLQGVEQLLESTLGRHIKVNSVTYKPSPFATLFPVYVVSLTFEGGGKMTLFMKNYGDEQIDHPEKQVRDREIKIYEQFLREDDLPVVKYYGSTWNEATQNRQLFLEYIDDWDLNYQDLIHWYRAAARLAHLHAYFESQTRKLLASDFLLRFDADYFYPWAPRAQSAVSEFSAGLGQKLEKVVENYSRIVEILVKQPLTIVHNDLSPKNVMVDRSKIPARICFVDWEMAGVGCGLLDLVHLKYGLGPVDDEKMVSSYCKELAGTGLLPSAPQELRNLLAACEVHKIVYRLAFSKIWQVPIERVARMVGEVETYFGRI